MLCNIRRRGVGDVTHRSRGYRTNPLISLLFPFRSVFDSLCGVQLHQRTLVFIADPSFSVLLNCRYLLVLFLGLRVH